MKDYSVTENHRDDGWTDIIVTTEDGKVAHEKYFLDCDRGSRLESAIEKALNK